MKQNICYKLLLSLGNIYGIYTDDENNDVAIIEKRGKCYFVQYNFLTSPCAGGTYNTFIDACNEIEKLRPKAFFVE